MSGYDGDAADDIAISSYEFLREERIEKEEELYQKYKPTLEHYHYQEENIIPQIGDYMVATEQHFRAIIAGRVVEKLNMRNPGPTVSIMTIDERGLTIMHWGSPAHQKARAIYSHSPGHWKLGLTPAYEQVLPLPKTDTEICL